MTLMTAIFFGSLKVVNANESTAIPSIVANDYNTTQDGYAYINIEAKDFENISCFQKMFSILK